VEAAARNNKRTPDRKPYVPVALAADTFHGRGDDSRNGPGRDTLLAAKIDFRLKQEVVNSWLLAEDKTCW
jgi:hypothetical protein